MRNIAAILNLWANHKRWQTHSHLEGTMSSWGMTVGMTGGVHTLGTQSVTGLALLLVSNYMLPQRALIGPNQPALRSPVQVDWVAWSALLIERKGVSTDPAFKGEFFLEPHKSSPQESFQETISSALSPQLCAFRPLPRHMDVSIPR